MTQKNDEDTNYDRVIILIQYYVQLFWLVFGAFLLSVTVLLGGLVAIIESAPSEWIFAGAIFGFLLCIPWWTSFQYNHAFYLLRINEAKSFEPAASGSRFFLNGEDLYMGKTVYDVKLPRYAVWLRPKKSVSLLIVLFVIAFLSIAIIKNPFYSFDISSKSSTHCEKIIDSVNVK